MIGTGFNREAGKLLDGFDHVRQSLATLFETPINSRVMRREFGCELHALIDKPLNDKTILASFSAIITACELWEPRFKISQCNITTANQSGEVIININGDYYPRGHLGDYSTVHNNINVDIPFGILR